MRFRGDLERSRFVDENVHFSWSISELQTALGLFTRPSQLSG